MSDKNNDSSQNDIELAQIEQFYKNIRLSEKRKAEKMKLKSKDKATPDITDDFDEDIHESVYGLEKKGKSVIGYCVTAIFCIAIITGSYLYTVFMPGDEARINQAVEQKRLEKSYAELKSQYESLLYEQNKLYTESEEKEKNVTAIEDYENTKASLRTSIEEKKQILLDLNTQLTEKQSQLSALEGALAQKNINPISLSPGKYTVGKNILPGKYSVSGTGKFMVASSDGTSKINTVLGADPHETILEKDDIIKLETTAKFTPIY